MTEDAFSETKPASVSPSAPSRFAALSRMTAASVLLLAAALMAFGLWLPALPSPSGPVAGGSDRAFYGAVVARMRGGQGYEAAAVAEQRAQDYPLRPFFVVRPPALAIALSWLPDERSGDILLAMLAASVIGLWALRLQAAGPGPWRLVAAALIVFTGVGASMAGAGASLFHETWAGLLIALSLAVRDEKRFTAAVLFGFLAALIRELAMPYLVVMALLALVERRRAEAVAFAAALAAALAALALHAHAVMALVSASDPPSPGWVAFGGWRFVLASAKWNLIVLSAGSWTAAIIVPLALLGAGAWRDGAGLRLGVLLAGYSFGFMILGRPANDYWGLVTAPLLAVGLCFAPPALRDLFRRITGPGSPRGSAALPG